MRGNWDNRSESHHNIQVKIEASKCYFRDSVCREYRKERMYLKGIVVLTVGEMKKAAAKKVYAFFHRGGFLSI
jgi:hypothetical protein